MAMKTLFISAGVGVAAIVGSLCCILPIAAVLFGVGGLGFAVLFESVRWVFLTLTFLFLGLGFYLVYFRKNEECEGEGSCAAPKRKRKQKIALWSVTILAAVLIPLPYYSGYLLTAFPSKAPRSKVDYIMFAPEERWRVIKLRVIADKIASDHCALVAELELQPRRVKRGQSK